ncbi:MAG: FAD-dependent oxidoreductase [Armatimonadetes bacterium]|nr:FAD-dependent oxidoreductase [Armatimonadota bacterium]
MTETNTSALEPSGDPVRVGVYVCHCGGNISDVIDTKAVAAALAAHPNVAVSNDYMFMCSDPGQALIIDDIKANHINRVVVAACSPTLHEITFRKALQRAGLNPYLFEYVNIREQASWVHKGDHEGATRKAVRLVAAGVEKVVRQDELFPIKVGVEPHVVVVGGGVAGMSAAVALAGRGLGVTLVEKGVALGGRVADLDRVYPTEERGADLVQDLTRQVEGHSRIDVRLGSEVVGLDGHVGKFAVTVRTSSAAPDDQDHLVRAGAVVIATGFDHYKPAQGEHGFGESPAVVTLPDFQAALRQCPASRRGLQVNGRPARSVAFIHCVGSRQIDGVHAPQADGKVNDYCSRTCCTATLHTIRQVQSRFPDVDVYDLHKDIRTYGRGHEAYYEDASRAGALFFRFPDEEPPTFAASTGGEYAGTVTTRDILTWGEELEIPVDLVVLATGMVPRDIASLIDLRKLPVGADRFLQEVHPKLRPVETGVAGILLAGACQGPMDINEACTAAQTAAVKAAILLANPTIELDPFVAVVDGERCDGCGKCLAECEYVGALTMADVEQAGATVRHAVVNPAMCVGCGACAAVCSPRAINVAGWTLDQFDAMVDAIIAEDVGALAHTECRAGVRHIEFAVISGGN